MFNPKKHPQHLVKHIHGLKQSKNMHENPQSPITKNFCVLKSPI